MDINKKVYYCNNENVERTKRRLTQMNEIGMTEVGDAQFGVEGIMSGLYIERVWSYDDEKFDDYLNWVKTLIKEKDDKNN